MRTQGVTYDTGFVNAGTSTLLEWDPDAVEFDLAAIRDELHCNAVRPTGADPDRLEDAAQAGVAAGLDVWLSPFTCDLTNDETADLLEDCAQRAERLRRAGGRVTLVCGAELSFVGIGFHPGPRIEDRVPLLRRIHSTGSTMAEASERLNEFFASSLPRIRRSFSGPISYASAWSESIDWRPFDIVGVDAYRSAEDADTFAPALDRLFDWGKPVAVTEFGFGTYTGATAMGAHAEEVVAWEGVTPSHLSVHCERNEAEQADAIAGLHRDFTRQGVDAAFVHTFGFWHMTHREDPTRDLDRAGYGLVKFRGNGVDGPIETRWQPKESYRAVARMYRAS